MNLALLIVLVVLATAALTISLVIFFTGKKAGDEQDLILSKIRTVISKALVQAVVFYQAAEIGYDELQEQVITWLKAEIDTADFLTEAEKMFLSYNLLLSFLGPQLRKLWDNGSLDQLAEETNIMLNQ